MLARVYPTYPKYPNVLKPFNPNSQEKGKLLVFMKHSLILLFFVAHSCIAQEWQAEIGAGVAGYNGDLTKRNFSFKTIGPELNIGFKYSFDNLIILRGDISWAHVKGDDKFNKEELRTRNLRFQTNILEGSLCAEVNLLEPEIFTVYPYLFGGIGVFHFNPYTYDKTNTKRYLQPLGTEGQGLPQYPGRKKYSLTQFSFPMGIGIKFRLNDKYDLAYEIGYRVLTTDYLDDVSTTYVDLEALSLARGPIAAELSSRHDLGFQGVDAVRGNPGVKDWYYFGNFKLIFHLNKVFQTKKKKKDEDSENIAPDSGN